MGFRGREREPTRRFWRRREWDSVAQTLLLLHVQLREAASGVFNCSVFCFTSIADLLLCSFDNGSRELTSNQDEEIYSLSISRFSGWREKCGRGHWEPNLKTNNAKKLKEKKNVRMCYKRQCHYSLSICSWLDLVQFDVTLSHKSLFVQWKTCNVSQLHSQTLCSYSLSTNLPSTPNIS